MGAQWKHAGRVANSSKRGALISKLVKEITVAAKGGDANPDNNPRLRAGVEAAKKASVPRDTIERAIKKGAGLLDDGVVYESVFYEGFTPHRVPVIVECVTDNKNRTAADVRVLFRKGSLGSVGAVSWMFDRLGVVEATIAKPGIDIEEIAIEADAQNVEALEAEDVPAGSTGARFFTAATDLDKVSKAVAQMGWTVTLCELSYIPKSFPDLSDDQKKEVASFLNDLNDCDDVHRIYAGMQ